MKKPFLYLILLFLFVFSFQSICVLAGETQIASCDSTTDWTVVSGCTLGTDSDDKQEGTANLLVTGTAYNAYFYYDPDGNWDFSGNEYLKFWVKASKITGPFLIQLRCPDYNNRAERTYTVSQADTWEEISLDGLDDWNGWSETGSPDNTQVDLIYFQYGGGVSGETLKVDDIRIETAGDSYPSYSNAGDDGITQVGENVVFSCYWQDNLDLETCYLWTNNSGTATNHSITISGTAQWANQTIQLNYTTSMVVQYKWYCADNASQWNTTDTYSLTTTPLYVTWNHNNATRGSFYVDGTQKNNGTQNPYDYSQSISLQGLPSSSSYVFSNYTWTGGSNTSNPYSYTSNGNNTVWCYFDEAGTGTNVYDLITPIFFGGIFLIAVTIIWLIMKR